MPGGAFPSGGRERRRHPAESSAHQEMHGRQKEVLRWCSPRHVSILLPGFFPPESFTLAVYMYRITIYLPILSHREPERKNMSKHQYLQLTFTLHSVLSLILVFLNSAGLLLLLGLDFFAMLFLVVYVGAVAVLSLFVVMMLNVKSAEISEINLRYLPVGGL